MVLKQATIAVHSGLNEDERYGCIVPPVVLSSTYSFSSFNNPGIYDYSRRSNPTRDVAQRVLAELEHGVGSVITSSGMSAIYLLCMAFLAPGDLIVAPYDCYGGSYRLLDSLSRGGYYRVHFIDQSNLHVLSNELSNDPKLVFIETPSNPLLRVVDISAICSMRHKTDTLFVVDNTLMSPVLQQPLTFGADIVVHSCTKYLNGHSDLISGAVVVKDDTILDKLLWWSNTLGITGSAFDSYQLLRGIRTLVPRINQQQSNAQSIVAFLKKQRRVKAVYYPGLHDNMNYEVICKQQKGFGSIISFELDSNLEILNKFLSSLKLFILAESFGGVESLISHAATMTHAGMPEDARKFAGINNMLLRLSVGIEDSCDLIDDLKFAFQIIN